MKTLVFPDLHERPFPEELIAKINADEVVFLGDYFDQYYDTPLKAQITAMQLQDSLKHPNRHHVMGNHDLHYRYIARRFQCPGFNVEKYEAINSIMNMSDWYKMKYFYISQGFLFTHAGLHPSFVPKNSPDMTYIREFMGDQSRKAHWCACENRKHWFWHRGPERGGMDRCGGIMWLGWEGFQPIEGVNQIIGHSCHIDPQFLIRDNTFNLNLDTAFCHYALITDGKVETFIIDQDHYDKRKKAWAERGLLTP